MSLHQRLAPEAVVAGPAPCWPAERTPLRRAGNDAANSAPTAFALHQEIGALGPPNWAIDGLVIRPMMGTTARPWSGGCSQPSQAGSGGQGRGGGGGRPKQALDPLLQLASAQVIQLLLKASRGVALERPDPQLLEANFPT